MRNRAAIIWFGICICVAGGALGHGMFVQHMRSRVAVLHRAVFPSSTPYTFQSIARTKDAVVGMTASPTQLVIFAPPTTAEAPIEIRRIIRVPDETNARIQSSPAHNSIAIGTSTSTRLIDVESGEQWTFPVDQNTTVLNPTSLELVSLHTQGERLQLTQYTPDHPAKLIPLPLLNHHDAQLPAISWKGDGTSVYIADDEPTEEHEHDGDIVNTPFLHVPLANPTQITTTSFEAFRVTDQPNTPHGYHLLLRAHDAGASPETYDPNGDGVVGTFLFAITEDMSTSSAILMGPEFTAQADMVHCMWTTTDALACVAQLTRQNGQPIFVSRTVSVQAQRQQQAPLPRGFATQQVVQGMHPELFILLEATTKRLYLVRMSSIP